jgi:putative hydrolase of the HAD superfamily
MPDRSAVLIAVDLDDTLFSEFDYAESALRAACDVLERNTLRTGLADLAVSLLRQEKRSAQPLQDALAQLNVAPTPSDLDAAIGVMRAHVPVLELFGDVRPALTMLKPYGTLALVTEGRAVTQQAKIDALQVRPLFDHVIVTSDLPEPNLKVTGVPYRALREMCPAATRRFMIGDNPQKDGNPAEAAGFTPLVVRRPDVRYVHPAGTERVFQSFLAAAESVISRITLGTDG